jgi:hypothetical protein
MKPKKIREALESRIKAWNEMSTGGAIHGGKTKIINGMAFRKPGSQKKH